jgi:outer membrane protein assembly factor BamD
MSYAMYQKLVYSFLIIFLIFSCSKKEPELNIPANKEKSFDIYKEAVKAMDKGDYFFASKKFSEAEAILPKIEFSAKAALMSSYCLYLINFYPEATANLERFINQYPTDKNVAYAHYLIAITLYEQILDEKKDINPLISSKEKIFFF